MGENHAFFRAFSFRSQPLNIRICPESCPYVIHLVVCLTTGPKPLPKPALHIVRSRASSFKWEYPLLSLRSSNSFLRLLPCLPVTSIPPCISPSITRCRRQFLRKMWPIKFAFCLRISCRKANGKTTTLLIFLESFFPKTVINISPYQLLINCRRFEGACNLLPQIIEVVPCKRSYQYHPRLLYLINN